MKISKSVLSLGVFSAATFISSACFAQQSPATTEAPLQVPGSASPQAPAGAPPWLNFVLIGGIIIFMWLFVFRPQSKRAKEQKEFLSSLAPGLEVVTSGGVIGTITEVSDNIVSLNVGTSTMKVLKSAISGKLNATAVDKPK